jgi:hypothetical protein
MLHHSKFSLFAFLALLCAAVASCTSSNRLSADPQTAETILEESSDHGATVTLMNGDTIHCYAVSVRKDSTRWQLIKSGLEVLGPETSVATDSILSIRIGYSKIQSGLVSRAEVGAFGGWASGFVLGLLTPVSVSILGIPFKFPFDFTYALQTSLVGGVVGLVVGGIIGGIIGAADNGTVWRGGGKWDSTHDQWLYPSMDSLRLRDTIDTKLPH